MAARQLLLWLRMDLHDEDSRFFSTVSRFPPCPHPPHQSTAPCLSPLHLISAPTSPLGTSGPQLCERLRCRERSRGGGEWGLLMGLAEAIEDVFGVEDGGAVVRWIYRQPHSYDAPVPPTPCLRTVPASRVPISGPSIPHLCNMGALFTGNPRASKCTPSRAPPHLPLTTLTLFLSSSTPLFTSFTPASPTPTSGLLKPRSYAPHLLLPRHLLPHGLPHTHGTGALLTQEEVAAMAELHGRLQAKLGEARLLGSPWRFLRMAGQREEEVRPK
ncbi:unnamed protein product [Closterium sp. NIES-64]|nr:unnamed protein product [Closterium sp. NIES-64]